MFSDLPTFSHIQQAKTKPELALRAMELLPVLYPLDDMPL